MAGRDDEPGGKPPAAAEDEGFLSRWSRRKAEAKTADDATGDATGVGVSEPQEGAAIAESANETPAIDPTTLPDIDSLGPSSDFSVFMQAGVPPALKTKALRRLWQVKPGLANLDGLIDYGEDLTGSFKVVDHLKTAYDVGRGFLKDEEKEPATLEEQAPDQPENEALADADPQERPGDAALAIDVGDTKGVEPVAVESQPSKKT